MDKNVNINYRTLFSWISGHNPIPISKTYILLRFWKDSCNKSEEEFSEKWNKIYKVSVGYSQCAERKVKLPKELNENLGYLIGFFQGDGHLKKENKKGFQEYSIYFYDGIKVVLDNINKIIQEELGIRGRIYLGTNPYGHEWYVLRITSKPIYIFLKNVLGLRPGKTVRTTETPNIIKEAKLPIQLSFIKGFFDAEGTVGESTKNPWLEVGQASKNSPCEILLWTRDKLNENKIFFKEPKKNSNQEFFRLRTAKRENIKRFFEVVSSEHPEKIIKFKKIIEKCQNR